jgi:uncharacterized protein
MEHFFPEGLMSARLDASTAETCNTYNMLKLTEHVFGWDPKAEYTDFYERALYNDILASQEPRMGMFTYFMSLEPGLFKTYSTPYDSFWCCVGTGMENHTKYGEAIYFHGHDDLYVNLFIPSALTWRDQSFALQQDTDYPTENRTRLTITQAPSAPVEIKVRCPGWAAGNVALDLDGKPLDIPGTPGSYASVRRVWSKGDILTVTIPMTVRTESLPDDPEKVAFLYGPVVLAGDMGPEPQGDTVPYSIDQRANVDAAAAPVPILVRGSGPLESSVVRSAGGSLVFHTLGVGHPGDVVLRPFWEISYDRYSVYWDVLTEAQWRDNGNREPVGL